MTRKTLLVTVSAVSSLLFLGKMKKDREDYQPIVKHTPAVQEPTAAQNYQNYCAGCHGEKMDMFVDRNWKHGNTVKDLIHGIKEGYENEGMPAFKEAFSDTEIKALAEYILGGIQNVAAYNFDAEPLTGTFKTEQLTIQLDTVATGLDIPWGIAFLPNNELLVTERGGTLYRIDSKRKKTAIKGVPEVVVEGQGGLLDIIVSPEKQNGNTVVFFSYSKGKKTGSKKLATTAVMRAELKGNSLVNQTIIFEANPYAPTRHHYGSRLVLKDGYLYISVGERGNEKENPQSLGDNQLGKIHRIYPDGSLPPDNPFKNAAGKPTSIYCYGNRNAQGLAFNPWSNELWENEHGPRGGDEINIIKPGLNFGWPLISYGINYNGKLITDKTSAPGMQQPISYWIPSIAPSGMAFVTGDRYKPWKGGVLVGSLRFKYLNLCYLDGDTVVKEEKLLKNIGRLRDVRMGPDGYVYIAVESPAAAVYRLLPVE